MCRTQGDDTPGTDAEDLQGRIGGRRRGLLKADELCMAEHVCMSPFRSNESALLYSDYQRWLHGGAGSGLVESSN
jgi:hypothetical protein